MTHNLSIEHGLVEKVHYRKNFEKIKFSKADFSEIILKLHCTLAANGLNWEKIFKYESRFAMYDKNYPRKKSRFFSLLIGAQGLNKKITNLRPEIKITKKF